MKTLASILLTLTATLLSSCATDTTSYISETAGETLYSVENIEQGSFRLGKANGLDANIGFLRRAKENKQVDEIFKILAKKPNGTDLNYFYLAWASEQKGFTDAAFEYYSISKKLFLFSRTVKVGEPGYIRSHYVSVCGEWDHKYKEDSRACPKNMLGELNRSIQRTSPF